MGQARSGGVSPVSNTRRVSLVDRARAGCGTRFWFSERARRCRCAPPDGLRVRAVGAAPVLRGRRRAAPSGARAGSIASSRSRPAERVTARRSAGPPPPPGRPAGSGTSYVARARPAPVTHPPLIAVWRRRLFIRVRVFVRERTRVILRWPRGRLTVSDVTSPGSRPAQRWHVRLSAHVSP